MVRECLVDERMLPLSQSFRGAARRKSISLVGTPVYDRREQLIHTRQASSPVLPVPSQRLPEHKLPAVRKVSAVQPVASDFPRLEADDAGYIRPGRTRVDTGDQKIRIRQVAPACDIVRQCFPGYAPEQIQAVDQDYRLVQTG